MIGTFRNKELTGNRNDLALSNAMRSIPRVRTLDLDMMIWNETYTQCMAVIEASSTTGHKSTRVSRKIAQSQGAFTILVIHAWNDTDNKQPIKVSLWYPSGKKAYTDVEMTWEELQTFVDEDLRDWYEPKITMKHLDAELGEN